ncbi:site-2 protease family protein [Marinobacter sp. M1N3S26]|uniref:site-2 protease family protein n=1 Tax=Marinobacter sp. M1N3S26 TaxID=3382299 RepID=UPI00387B356C
MTQIVVIAVLLVAIAFAAMFVAAYRQIRSMRWKQAPVFTPIDAHRVPGNEKSLVEEKARELEALGFEPRFWLVINPPMSHPDSTLHGLVLFHPDTGSYGEVTIHPQPEPGHEFNVEFLHFPVNGDILYTTNRIRHVLGVTPQGYQWEDPYLDTLDELWDYHRNRVSGQAANAREVSASEFCRHGHAFFDGLATELCHRGDLTMGNREAGYRFSHLGAWRLIRRMQKAGSKLAKATTHNDPQTPMFPDPRVSVIAHANNEADMARKPAPASHKLGLLLVSLVLFMISFGMRLDLTALIVLVAVLFFHEMGHIAAMRLCGFQRLQVLFIPFLGAIARGEKEGASPLQGTFIALAGPVPGILLGAALWLTYPEWSPEWMSTLIFMLLFINFFNLLPIYPLDGGQVANLLIFQRWPGLQAAFGGTSMLAFFGLAWWLSEPLLAGIGILLAFGLVHQYREAQVLAHIRRGARDGQKTGEAPSLHAIYQGFEATRTILPFHGRFQLARGLSKRLKEPTPTLRDSVIGLALYLLFLLGTPVAAAYHGIVDWPFNDYETVDWEARLAETEDDATRAQVLYSAARDAYYMDRFQKAREYLDESRELLARLGLSESLSMARNLHLSAEIAHYYDEELAGDDTEALEQLRKDAINDLQRAVELYQLNESTVEAIDGHAEALDQLASIAETDDAPEQALAYLKEAEALWRQLAAEDNGYSLVYNLNHQARVYSELENHTAAIGRLRESMSVARSMDEFSRPYLLRTSANQLIDLHLDLGEYNRALALADELRDQPDMEPDLSERRAWAHFKLSDHTSARADLEAAITTLESNEGEDYRYYYDKEKADYLAQLLMVHREESHGGLTREPPTRDTERLLAELDAIDLSPEDYKAHLQRQCECGDKSGYRYQRSLLMRDAVHEYLP